MQFESKGSAECCKGDFLNLSLLRPGDVILTFPPRLSAESNAIKFLCGGRYSHAILVLKPTLWFESEDYGVGQTIIIPDRLEVKNGCVRLLRCLDRYGEICVLRHPDLEHDEEEGIISRLEAITSDLSYKRYPNYVRIAEGLRLLADLPLRNHLLQLVRRVVDLDVNEGMFCSEVIAYVFQSLGLPFKGKEPHQVRPSDIAIGSISGLIEQDFSCQADPTAHVSNETPSSEHEQLSRQSLAQVVQVRSTVAQIGLSVNAMRSRAIAGGMSAEELTPEGYPNVLLRLLHSEFELVNDTGQLVVNIALLVNLNTKQSLAEIEPEMRLLEDVVDAIDTGRHALDLATAAYCSIAKERHDIHSNWKVPLEDSFRNYETSSNAHLKAIGMLDREFKAAQEKATQWRTRHLLRKTSVRLDELMRALNLAHAALVGCFQLILGLDDVV